MLRSGYADTAKKEMEVSRQQNVLWDATEAEGFCWYFGQQSSTYIFVTNTALRTHCSIELYGMVTCSIKAEAHSVKG